MNLFKPVNDLIRKPLFGDFILLILMTVGAYALLSVTIYNAFEHGNASSAQEAGEGTVMGMIITGCFMVIQRNQELIKDRWHQMQTASMTEQLHKSTPSTGEGEPLDLTGSEIK